MLVLGVVEGERVYVTLPGGEVAEVLVTEVWGRKVKLGFKFPDDVLIHRESLYRQVKGNEEGSENS